ncbi:MAG: YncE family protein [Rhodospirillales bacterium]|nr:YncE family protein [Rhodospirillales bacterium]
MKRAAIAAALLVLFAAASADAAERAYRLVQTLKLGGAPRWDYLAVDAGARRLYLAQADQVAVIDLAARRVTGRVTGLAGAHGIAIVPALGRGFVANGDRNTLSVFALDELRLIDEAPVGAAPDGVVYDSATGRVFVFNGEDKSASVLDAHSLQPVGTIALGGTPEFAVADGRGALFVNIEESAELVRIDTRSATVAARSKIEGCDEPHGLALDPARRRLYSSCANRVLAVLDADSGRTLGRIAIGSGSDAVVYDQRRDLVHVSNGEGFVSVIDAASRRVLDQVQTRVTGRTMAIDPADGALLVPAVDLEIDWTARTARFAPDGLKLYRFERTGR